MYSVGRPNRRPGGERDRSGQLSNKFGIQAWQGEVACDQGAAEALGPDAAWRVAVYFETRGDASAFAVACRTLYPKSDPAIAHVTTYCLD